MRGVVLLVVLLLSACTATHSAPAPKIERRPVVNPQSANAPASASPTSPVNLVSDLLTSILPTYFADCGHSVIRLTESPDNAAERCAVAAVTEKRPFLLVRKTHGVDSSYVEIFFQNERTQNFRIGFDTNVCGFVNDSVAGCGPAMGLEPCIFELTGPSNARHVVCPERR